MSNSQPQEQSVLWRPSRRALLGAASLGATGLVLGGTQQQAAAHPGLAWHDEIWNVPTIWDSTGARRGDYYNPTFYSKLESWMSFYWGNTPGSWILPFSLRYAGVHSDKDGSCAGMTGSCHSYGRAIDLRHLSVTNAATMTMMNVFNGRYDQWGPGTTGSTTLKRYWAFVGSLNYYFTYVLHYHDSDTSHRNHVHADNSVSGSGDGVFSTGRKSQVYSTQECLKHIWGYTSITVDGLWGSQTDNLSRAALSRAGIGGALTTSAGHWRSFNAASLRFGTGTQNY